MFTTTRRAIGHTAALAATLVLLVIGVAAPAHADTPEEHCVILLGEDVADTVVCADSLEAADAAFTAETGFTRVESGEGSRALLVFSLATLYADASFGGSSYTFVRSTACNGVTLSSVPDLGALGLNDAVSSFLTYSTCTVRLYADTSYGGSTYGYTTTQSSLPTFNDTASSARAR